MVAPAVENFGVGDVLEIELPITSERWLRALLLRLGPHAEVVAPAVWRALGADAAADLLRRYESPVTPDPGVPAEGGG